MEQHAVDLLVGPVLAVLLAAAGLLHRAGVPLRDAFKKENQPLGTALGMAFGLLAYPVVVLFIQRGLDPESMDRLGVLDRKILYTAVAGVAFLFYQFVGAARELPKGSHPAPRWIVYLAIVEGLVVYPFIGLAVLTRRAAEWTDLPFSFAERATFLDRAANVWMIGFLLSFALHLFLIRKKMHWMESGEARSMAGYALSETPALAAAALFILQASK
jgi:hypothetical protein